MPTPNTNTATTSTYDEVTKKYQDALNNLNAASADYEKTASDIYNSSMEPGHSFEDFMNSVDVPEPTTKVDPKKERSRAMITNIADAINAMGGIIGAARGANVAPSASLTAANQQRYDKLVAQRDAERDAYNKALMNKQTWAMNMSDAYARRKQQDDARRLSAAETKLKTARTAYDLAGDALSRARTQERDAASDARADRAEQRSIQQYNDSQAKQAIKDYNSTIAQVKKFNDDEDKKWISYGGKEVAADKYADFMETAFKFLEKQQDVIAADKALINDVNGATKATDKLEFQKELVDKYFDKYRDGIIAEGEKLGAFGQKTKWGYDENSGKIIKLPSETPTPAPTPAPTPTQPTEQGKEDIQGYKISK